MLKLIPFWSSAGVVEALIPCVVAMLMAMRVSIICVLSRAVPRRLRSDLDVMFRLMKATQMTEAANRVVAISPKGSAIIAEPFLTFPGLECWCWTWWFVRSECLPFLLYNDNFAAVETKALSLKGRVLLPLRCWLPSSLFIFSLPMSVLLFSDSVSVRFCYFRVVVSLPPCPEAASVVSVVHLISIYESFCRFPASSQLPFTLLLLTLY